MIRRPPRSTRTDTPFPTRRSSDLKKRMSAEVIIVEVIGWTAAAIILAAYILLSLGKLDGRSYLYQWMNVIGAGGSEEHTSELQSLMRISYAVFCLKKKTRSKIAPITTEV